MAFLRRGHVPHHYEGPSSILVTLIGGTTQTVDVARIQCFEEHLFHGCLRSYVTIFTAGLNYTVTETFEEIELALREEEVQP